MNKDTEKVKEMTQYYCPWRTTDVPPLAKALKLIVSDYFADHNIGAIGIFVIDAMGAPKLKLCVGLKKCTMDPFSID